MVDTKLSGLTALTGANLATADDFEVTDVSDTTTAPAGAGGSSKHITASELAQGLYLIRDGLATSRHLPTGAIAATDDRSSPSSAAQSILTSGTLFMAAIDLVAGQVVTSVSFRSGSTAIITGTHQWFGLADSSRAVQRWTSDDTSTAWAAFTTKTLNLSSTYTVPSSGTYYLAIMVAAATVPNLMGWASINTHVSEVTPILMGNTTDSGLTTPPTIPFTAGAITAGTAMPWAWVS